MFFELSKLLWYIVQPANIFLIILLIAGGLSFCGINRWALRLTRITAFIGLLIALVPIGHFITMNLENRFPERPELPDKIHGLIILGGVINPKTSNSRESIQIGGAVERIIIGAELANKFPEAKVIFTGGAGDIFNPEAREAHHAPSLFKKLGVMDRRVIFEDKARNTYENAQYARLIASPKRDENWILVTSAFHMPRAMGVFRKLNWEMIPFPVDFSGGPDDKLGSPFSLLIGLGQLSAAMHELIGLIAYYLSGRTDTIYPAP